MSIVPSASYFVRALAAQRSAADTAVSVVLGNPTHDLPASEIEVRSIADLLGVRPFLGHDAVSSRVLRLTKRQAVIHIASHGVYESRDPLLSGIILADGRVSVEDLLDAHIPADLLVLSSCLTGMSAQQSGDELTGLARAALAAGAPSSLPLYGRSAMIQRENSFGGCTFTSRRDKTKMWPSEVPSGRWSMTTNIQVLQIGLHLFSSAISDDPPISNLRSNARNLA